MQVGLATEVLVREQDIPICIEGFIIYFSDRAACRYLDDQAGPFHPTSVQPRLGYHQETADDFLVG